MKEDPNEFDDHDMGRVVGITAAQPGWWAVQRDPKTNRELGRNPVAAWVVTEITERMTKNQLRYRYPVVHGVDPGGRGWSGEVLNSGDVEYVYDPDFRLSNEGTAEAREETG